MSFQNMIPPYVFIIDTDQYAGNFERQMVAYITSRVGDCGVGGHEAHLFWTHFYDNPILVCGEDCIIFDAVMLVPDEHGCKRPASIWDTPGWFNDGLGHCYKDGDEKKAQKIYTADCIEKSENPKSYVVQNHKETWLKMSKTPFIKSPAYLSVAVFYGERPCKDAVDVMVQRAYEFCGYAKTTAKGTLSLMNLDIHISGFRLIHQEVHQNNIWSK